MKRNRRVAIGCSITAALCFIIVSCGHFCRGRMEHGWAFAILSFAQLALAAANCILLKREQSESAPEDMQ